MRAEIPLLVIKPQPYGCPNCDTTWHGTLAPGSSRFHNCPRLHMLSAPLVPLGIACKTEAFEREDYLNGEVQRHGDDGKPYMAVKVTRDDGEDLAVNAGLARSRQGGD